MTEIDGSAQLRTVVFLLARLERLNDDLLTQACRRRGISAAEFRVLAVLRHGAAGEPVRPTTIGRWIVQSTGGLTSTLKRLEQEGRVERIEDPNDGRSLLVSLTRDGADFYDALLADVESTYAAVLGDVDLEQLAEAAQSALAAMERAGGHADSGLAPVALGLRSAGEVGTVG
ncbi:MAG: MarR family transcriptional regulator [Actinomycetia bacterium]|nr:MarR family transcriptional regulator [Actinomycetes bacterium]